MNPALFVQEVMNLPLVEVMKLAMLAVMSPAKCGKWAYVVSNHFLF